MEKSWFFSYPVTPARQTCCSSDRLPEYTILTLSFPVNLCSLGSYEDCFEYRQQESLESPYTRGSVYQMVLCALHSLRTVIFLLPCFFLQYVYRRTQLVQLVCHMSSCRKDKNHMNFPSWEDFESGWVLQVGKGELDNT